MSKLYGCCEGLREPDWSRYTRLEVSGSKDHDGETEALVFARDAEFFTVYGRLPSFEVEPITDCYDAVTLLAVAAELGDRSKLDVHLHPTLYTAPPQTREPCAPGEGKRVTLAFKVTLELDVPDGITLNDAAIEDYRNVLDNALEHQAGFGGLTPDYLSDEGLAVELFTVEHDKRSSDEATKGRRSVQKGQKVNSPERAIIVTVVNKNKVVTCEIFPRGYREEALVLWRQLHRDADENDTSSVRISYADAYRGPEAE